MRKKVFLFIVSIVAVFLIGCNEEIKKFELNEESLTKNINNELPNHFNFNKNILENDIYVYNYFNKNMYIFNNNDYESIENFKSLHLDSRNQKIYGQKGLKYSGSDSWLNPIVYYDLNTKKIVEIFKGDTELSVVRFLSARNENILLSKYKDKKDRWKIGKEELIEYSLQEKTYRKINPQFSENEMISINCAIYFREGYLVSYAYISDNNIEDVGNGLVFIDKNGALIENLSLNLDGHKVNVVKNLKASNDEKLIMFSDGESGENLYTYNFDTKYIKEVSKFNVMEPMWSLNDNSIYYTSFKLRSSPSEVNSYTLTRYDIE
jgi:hypothetical protein